MTASPSTGRWRGSTGRARRRRDGLCPRLRRGAGGAWPSGRGAQPLRVRRCGTRVSATGAPLATGVPERCDLYIGNRGHRVIGLSRPHRRLFWLHNPAQYLRKPQFAARIAWHRPTLVTTGTYHASTIPRWLIDGGRETIPYGVLDRFRHAETREPPPPRAIFTSNPLRGLDWLLELWVARIRPAVPAAELHIYAGSAVHGGSGAQICRTRMDAVLARAEALAGRRGAVATRRSGAQALVDVLPGARGRCSIAATGARPSAWRSRRRRRWACRRS